MLRSGRHSPACRQAAGPNPRIARSADGGGAVRKSFGIGIGVVVLALATIFPASSNAAKVGVELFGGWSTYALGDFNDSLQVLNENVGTQFADITSGSGGGLSLRVWPTQNVLMRATLEVMLAETQDSGVTFDIGPVNLLGSATYFFPTSR